MLGTLADPAGGFYVAQEATPGGDLLDLYYAWTLEAFDAAVPEEWSRLAHALFHVTPEGDLLLGAPARNRLFLTRPRADVAAELKMEMARVRDGEAAILEALRGARAQREAPALDRSIYADSTAIAAAALFHAGEVLGREDAMSAARAAVDRLIASIPRDGPFRHRIHPPPDPALDPPLAQDHVLGAWALVVAFEETGERRYLDTAMDLMQRARNLFWDAEAGGFLDTAVETAPFGYGAYRLPLHDDTGFPALNAMAARVLDRLWLHTGDGDHHERAAICLKGLIAVTGSLDHRAGGLGLALEGHLHPPTRYVVVGPAGDPLAEDLTRAARAVFDPGRVVVRLVRGSASDDAAIAALGVSRDEGSYAVACRGTECSAALTEASSIAAHAARESRGEREGAVH
jgi:uncharacterized protein YyaL (SSP411 family)